VQTNEENKTRIISSEPKDSTFYTKTSIEIKTLYLSKISHFYYSLFGEVKVRGVGNEDIARDLMIFLKYVSKSEMGIDDICIFAGLVDMGYCMIDGIVFVKYSEFTNTIDRLPPFETKLTIIDSILDIKDGCLNNVDDIFKCSGRFSENVIQDFIQKMCTIGIYRSTKMRGRCGSRYLLGSVNLQ
jgi:hypothetical protein